MSQTPIYGAWKTMLSRCRNQKFPTYINYGGRGITICNRWLKFENFYNDMGDRPCGKSLDRIDNDGPYNSENCRWSTRQEQNTNKRLYKKNYSGISGVSRRFGKWCVQIKRNNIVYHLGLTDDFFEACCLRKSAEAMWLLN